MKIVHVCLCGPYSDNFSYQENLLTKYHSRMGFECHVISSIYMWNDSGKVVECKERIYTNNDNVIVHRVEPKKSLFSKIKKYKNVYMILENIKPQIIFVHGCNFGDITTILKYVKKNPVEKLYFDNHSDETNSATNWLSKQILHKIYWKNKIKPIIPYVKTFYGVLPKRCDFLKDIYKIPNDKIKLLIMGLDDDYLNLKKDNDDVILSIGGKIDGKHQKLLLFEKRACR